MKERSELTRDNNRFNLNDIFFVEKIGDNGGARGIPVINTRYKLKNMRMNSTVTTTFTGERDIIAA